MGTTNGVVGSSDNGSALIAYGGFNVWCENGEWRRNGDLVEIRSGKEDRLPNQGPF